MPADTVVRARIDLATKERATKAFGRDGAFGLDAIRLLMVRIADEQRLPRSPSGSERGDPSGHR